MIPRRLMSRWPSPSVASWPRNPRATGKPAAERAMSCMNCGLSRAARIRALRSAVTASPPAAAQVKPRPRHRRGPVGPDREVDEPRGHGIVREAQHTPEIPGRNAGTGEIQEEYWEMRHRALERVPIGGAEDGVAQADRTVGV